MNIYLQIFYQPHWFCGCLICHPQIIWCRFKLWKPQLQFQLLCDNINSITSIQQHIFYCILLNMYLDNCHMIIYCYSSCAYLCYWKTNLFICGCFIYIVNFLGFNFYQRYFFSSGVILSNCLKLKIYLISSIYLPMFKKISFIMINFPCENITSWDFYASIGVVFGIFGQVVFHPSMDVDGFLIWVCVFWIYWIVSTIDYFNYSSFSQLTTLFAFLGFLYLNTYFLVISHLVVTLTSTTFTFVMIVCVSTIGWPSATVIDFPWNIFCISISFGQFVILCPFKPQMWHAYEDVFYVFWLGCATYVVATMV